MIYRLIHVGIGFLSYDRCPLVAVSFIAYQILQLILDKRCFLFQWKTYKGNSVYHTTLKLVDFVLGFALAHTFARV